MSSRSSRNEFFIRSGFALFVLALAAGPALGCNPDFGSGVLSDEAVLAAPVGDFRREMQRLKPETAPAFKAIMPEVKQSALEQSAEAEAADLAVAMESRHVPEATRQRLLVEVAAMRAAFIERARAIEQWKEKAWDPAQRGPEPVWTAPTMPEGLPAEFDLYLRGALAYRSGDRAQARKYFHDVLALPPGERHYRSAWAAFMLGKTLVDAEPEKSLAWFAKVRELVAQGFADSVGLAAASLGWEARAQLNLHHYDQAIELYLSQLNTGDDTAIPSLRLTVVKALADKPEVWTALAGNEACQRVVTAYIVAGGGPRYVDRYPLDKPALAQWLAAVESAGRGQVAGADRLAWAAYQAGDMAMAGRWEAKAAGDSAVGQWIAAKLLLREGKADEAAAVLARVSKLFPADETWNDMPDNGMTTGDYCSISPANQAQGELGALKLARRQYVDALDCLLRGHFWDDAAYVAERVLTPDELIAYVDRAWPESKEKATDKTPATNLRHLLARRLTRLGRWKDARAYFPASLQPTLDAYIAGIRGGYDLKRTNEERAASLWEAAKLARHSGMELLGTEVGPDEAEYGGYFEGPNTADAQKNRAQGTLVAASQDELNRIVQAASQPEKRFHYRYVAADHAWAAAALMPDGSDETAKVLAVAGTWLKIRDPQAADRFYKALVRRCRNTTLGWEADRLRWFPKVEGLAGA